MNRYKSLIAYTFAHFAVDFTTMFILVSLFGYQVNFGVSMYFIYNFIAFGLQPIIGYYCDNNPKVHVGFIGVIIVTISIFLWPVKILAVVIGAFGNACFHIGGGINSLTLAEGKISRSGIFVSTGVIGITLASYLARTETFLWYLPIIVMVISIILLKFFTNREEENIPCKFKIASSRVPFWWLVILVAIVIIIRNFIGSVFSTEWMREELILFSCIFVCLGKALGGGLADNLGARNVGSISLFLSIPFLYLGINNMVCFFIGTILFNMIMPISLCTITSKLPYSPGTSFGFTALSLLIGDIPFLVYVFYGMNPIILLIMIAISAIFTLIVTVNSKKEIV